MAKATTRYYRIKKRKKKRRTASQEMASSLSIIHSMFFLLLLLFFQTEWSVNLLSCKFCQTHFHFATFFKQRFLPRYKGCKEFLLACHKREQIWWSWPSMYCLSAPNISKNWFPSLWPTILATQVRKRPLLYSFCYRCQKGKKRPPSCLWCL